MYVTVPVTDDWLPVTWKLVILMVEVSIGSLNLAVIVVLRGIFIVLFNGVTDKICGGVLSSINIWTGTFLSIVVLSPN